MMDKKYFADIEYSKKLAKYFGDAEYWFGCRGDILSSNNVFNVDEIEDYEGNIYDSFYPAIHTDMVLEKLPQEIKLKRCDQEYKVKQICYLSINRINQIYYVSYEPLQDKQIKNEKLPNTLCQMFEWLVENEFVEINRE